MQDYQLIDSMFEIKDYNKKRPFASFLPGIAGTLGIPLWAFYVNRGQGIASFGLHDKNHPIIPFTPANKAYESTPIAGFRTFIKKDNRVYEPFHMASAQPHQMRMSAASFSLEETHEAWGLTTQVSYTGLSQQPLAGLIRTVTFTNNSASAMTLEVLDGLAEILPSGIQNEVFKSLSNIMASWITVDHVDQGSAFFTLRSSTSDSSEVTTVEDGHFYIATCHNQLQTLIVDPKIVFEHDTTKGQAIGLMNHSLKELKERAQVTTNQIPCAFVPCAFTLEPGASLTLRALIGHAKTIETLRSLLPQFNSLAFWENQETESQALTQTLTAEVATQTAFPLFDAYIEQCYLDNLLRGGYPLKIGPHIYHIYSRKHGDLERDYNFFSLAPEYYSQGPGNFRDVCQNRRLDVAFHPEVDTFNIVHFASLIQLDGYNPLSVNGVRFTCVDPDALKKALNSDTVWQTLQPHLASPYTPGHLIHALEASVAKEEAHHLLTVILEHSKLQFEANFGEGYWVDHFTYILDLIETYEGIYPDKLEALLFKDTTITSFESPVTVRPQSEKIQRNQHGKVRQYHALRHPDKEKMERLKLPEYGTAWTQLNGSDYQTNLYTKLFILVLTKHANLDRFDYGIEMEAEKPGWNDAMNGVPGLLGSGVAESIELYRLSHFLTQHPPHEPLSVPEEVAAFFKALEPLPVYDLRVQARERYRERLRFGLAGTLETVQPHRYIEALSAFLKTRLEVLIQNEGPILPTFITTEAQDVTHQGTEVSLSEAHCSPLPPFLEAPARLLKTDIAHTTLQQMHQHIVNSELYDPALKIYKTSVSLEDCSHEIGRIKAFTPGWLERESNFLHMTYKYLLGLLKGGLYDAFDDALMTNLVCFMDPAVYGRSPLENSSFIVPSNNPDPSMHGQGFFARLSGSTIEALNMWYVMMTGGQPFIIEDRQLTFRLAPKLHRRFFKDGIVRFKLFNTTWVTLHNHADVSTYERCDLGSVEIKDHEKTLIFRDGLVRGETAHNLRLGLYDTITIHINE